MDQNLIFDLSSDEDVGLGENSGVGNDVEDSKWIQDFFNDFEKNYDSSDDAVFVSDAAVNPKVNLKNSSKDFVKDFDGDGDGDDDDCVILDGDPDKTVEVQNDVGVIDSDELVVVGETGQVACRDYPHPRDLCAKFPFASTPHEQYCNQCHCYVCDSLAPCLQWATGISSSDHCHATGKEEIWNQQRQRLKKSHQSTETVPKVPCTSMSAAPIQINQSPASTPYIQYNIPPIQVSVSAPISSMQYHTPQTQFPRTTPIPQIQCHTFQAQTPRPASLRPCTTAAINIPSTGGQRSVYVMPINNLQLNLASQQFSSTGNNVVARDRRHTVGSLGPRVNVPTAAPTAVFKRRGLPGAALASNQKNGYLINGNGSTKFTSIPHPLAPGNSNYMVSAEKNMKSNSRWPSSQPCVQTIPSSLMAFQPHLQPHLSAQSSVATTSFKPVPTQPLLSTQSNTGNVLVNLTSQHQTASHQAYAGGTFFRPVSPQPQVSSQPIITNSFGNTLPSEPPVYSQPNHALNNHQNVFQQQNQTNNFGDTSFSDIDLSWVTNTTNTASLSSQQSQAQNSQLPGLGFLDESLPFGSFDCFFGGSSNTGSFGFRHDNWTLDSEELARPSSEPASATLESGTFSAEFLQCPVTFLEYSTG